MHYRKALLPCPAQAEVTGEFAPVGVRPPFMNKDGGKYGGNSGHCEVLGLWALSTPIGPKKAGVIVLNITVPQKHMLSYIAAVVRQKAAFPHTRCPMVTSCFTNMPMELSKSSIAVEGLDETSDNVGHITSKERIEQIPAESKTEATAQTAFCGYEVGFTRLILIYIGYAMDHSGLRHH